MVEKYNISSKIFENNKYNEYNTKASKLILLILIKNQFLNKINNIKS